MTGTEIATLYCDMCVNHRENPCLKCAMVASKIDAEIDLRKSDLSKLVGAVTMMLFEIEGSLGRLRWPEQVAISRVKETLAEIGMAQWSAVP